MGWATEYIARLKNGETVQFRPRGNSRRGKIQVAGLPDHAGVDEFYKALMKHWPVEEAESGSGPS